MSEIKIINLISGAPIIAKVDIDPKTENYILEDPLTIVYGQKNKDDTPKFSAFQLLILSIDSVIEVSKNNVLYSYNPLPEIVDQYNTMLLNQLIPIDDDD